MIITFTDFEQLLKLSRNQVQILRVLCWKSTNRFAEVIPGELVNHARDKEYTLDNVRARSTHVELPENLQYLDVLYPGMLQTLQKGDVYLPRDEFFLMQDVYELEDPSSRTKGWESRDIVPVSEVSTALVCENTRVDLQEGTLIDRGILNLLRRPYSYIRDGDVYRRTVNSRFLVRPRPRRLVIVVDRDQDKKSLESRLAKAIDFVADYYVLADTGIDLQRLDSGNAKHIRLNSYLAEVRYNPDLVLFAEQREKFLANLRDHIRRVKQSNRLNSPLRGLQAELLPHNANIDKLNQMIAVLFDLRAIPDDERSLAELIFADPYLSMPVELENVVACLRNSMSRLKYSDEQINQSYTAAVETTAKQLEELIIHKGLPASYTPQVLEQMRPEMRDSAYEGFLRNNRNKVARTREAILAELLIDRLYDLLLPLLSTRFEKPTTASECLQLCTQKRGGQALAYIKEIHGDCITIDMTGDEIAQRYARQYEVLRKTCVAEEICRQLKLTDQPLLSPNKPRTTLLSRPSQKTETAAIIGGA